MYALMAQPIYYNYTTITPNQLKQIFFQSLVHSSSCLYQIKMIYIAQGVGNISNIISTMPRVAKSIKQKNKKFKGSKGTKKAFVKEKTKTKGIAKVRSKGKLSKSQRIKNESGKKEREVQKITNANEYLDAQTKGAVAQKLKTQNQIRIVLLVPCNQNADIASLISSLAFYCEQQPTLVLRKDLNACTAFPAFQVFPGPNKSPIRNRLFIVGSHRQPRELIDLAKCADIICPVVSTLSANVQRIVEDPYNFGGAFDQAGYATINLLRSLGLPKVVGIIQHLDQIDTRHQAKIQRFYNRFIVSEFGQKCLTMSNSFEMATLLRVVDSCSLSNQHWKSQRGYLLADEVAVSNNNVTISGFLKGSCINSNQIAHLTAFEDYHIQQIEILATGTRQKLTHSEQLVQYQTLPEEIYPFSRAQTHNDEDILSAIQGLQLAQQQKPMEAEQQEMQQQEDEQQNWEDEYLQGKDEKAEERAKRVEMQMRGEDQLQFEDQVEYAAEETLRQKYRYYQGLKSFKSTQWNELENLPSQYDRIFFFKNYNQTHHAAVKDNLSRGFAYPGFYVRVTLKGVQPHKLLDYVTKMPVILSFLLKHERKMTVLHGKVQLNPYYQGKTQINSNQLVMVSLGFRRVLVNPIYSRCFNGTQKTKYSKKIGQNSEGYFYSSFYGLNQFPPSPFLIFRVNPLFTEQIEGAPILRGELAKCDPHHIILQRIILTGYPFKINRRRSTIRFMFFNPNDVKYFKPIELRTKLGLRGKIEQSLGTHGLMKCLFNEHIKHNDTVCMHLYKRVFPQAFF